MTPIDMRAETLRKRLAGLRSRMSEIDRELDAHGAEKDWEDQAQLREADEVLEGLGEAGRREVQMIRAALARIDEGVYGHCTRCGEAIAEERLDLLPHTPFCRHCAG